MTKERIENWLGNRMKDHPGNVISADFAIRPELVGVHFFDEPLVGIGSAEDPLFDEYKKEGVIGPWHLSPKEWMPEANTVVSVFFPFTEEVRRSNRETEGEPSAEWLHGRIEGQAFLADTMRELAAWMNEQNVPTLVPAQDERFQSVMGGQGITGYENINEKTYGSRWSERHAAYVCGLGTFGLSKGIITEKGMAGRFGSLVTVMEAEPDVRKFCFAEFNGDIAAVGDLLRIFYGFRCVREDRAHLILALHIELAAGIAHAVLVGELFAGLNTQEDIVGLRVPGIGIMAVVRRDQRDTEFLRHRKKRGIDLLLIRVTMILQLEEEVALPEAVIVFEGGLLRRADVAAQ